MKNNSQILGNLVGKDVTVEENCYIGENTTIISNHIHIKKNTTIKGLKAHTPEKFVIGECGYIGNDCTFKCLSFEVGDYLWMVDGAEIGRGGCEGPNSKVKIGNYCMFTERVLLNPSEAVTIGDDVAMGSDVQVWTHGSFLDVMGGFPATFGPVTVGNHVWIPSRSILLPGTTIGDNVVIGIDSLINKSIPSGCLASGVPIKILAKNVYPKNLTSDEKKTIIEEILHIWLSEIVPFKKISSVYSLKYEPDCKLIILEQYDKTTVYDVDKRKIGGKEDDVTEDLRDFLRRRGIKFFTGKPFKSITPPIFVK
jgi:acetyltransferase-like isoleucine patch superfamily enzyme